MRGLEQEIDRIGPAHQMRADHRREGIRHGSKQHRDGVPRPHSALAEEMRHRMNAPQQCTIGDGFDGRVRRPALQRPDRDPFRTTLRDTGDLLIDRASGPDGLGRRFFKRFDIAQRCNRHVTSSS